MLSAFFIRGLLGFFYEFKKPCRAGERILQLGKHIGNLVKGLCVLVGIA